MNARPFRGDLPGKACVFWHQSGMLKMLALCLFSVLVVFSSSTIHATRAVRISATHNFSSREILVKQKLCVGTVAVFINSFSDTKRVTYGRYYGYAVIVEPNKPPVIYENILAIAVATSFEHGRDITEVLEHECQHHHQRLRYRTYFDFLAAYQKNPAPFEEEAQAATTRSSEHIAEVGKKKKPVSATVIFQ